MPYGYEKLKAWTASINRKHDVSIKSIKRKAIGYTSGGQKREALNILIVLLKRKKVKKEIRAYLQKK